LEKYGPNTLEQGERLNILKIFIRQFADPLIYILLIAAVFTAYIQQFIDMWVIIAVVVINAIIGLSQEIKAEQAVRSLACSGCSQSLCHS
jgi:Ca2+-transporting ATPase